MNGNLGKDQYINEERILGHYFDEVICTMFSGEEKNYLSLQKFGRSLKTCILLNAHLQKFSGAICSKYPFYI